MSARERLINAIDATAASDMYDSSPERLVNDFAHELAERLRNVHGSGEGGAWNWWDAAEIPGACADLIDPRPVSSEEPST
ncbi:hypothetical protein ACPESV_24505 [Streptomyces umbrinus]|uniref:hypothetical protein n=1 Tax=Streptomyces umbrinus TaxID=67370 RepID=UPI003C2CFE4B